MKRHTQNVIPTPQASRMNGQRENQEQHQGKGDKELLGPAFSEQREARECLVQPASYDKRNLLTRSPCSGKELFWDPLPPLRAKAGEQTISRVMQKLHLAARSWLLAPGPAFVPWASKAWWLWWAQCRHPLGQAAATWDHLSTMLAPTSPGEYGG